MNEDKQEKMKRRRQFLQTAGLGVLGMLSVSGRSWAAAMETLAVGNGERELVAYPQKRKLMRITTRPPHLETPFEVFDEGILTANDAFFVRYHLAGLPLSIDPASYRLQVSGHVERPLSLSLKELQAMETVEVVAVNQCSGNSRAYASPRVFGAQLGNGSMGNAHWTGVALKTLLDKAGVKDGAAVVAFNGLDNPVLPSTPDFIKTLDIAHAQNGEPLLAWHMNGEELPFLNGYPLKLIVPGYFGTYWVKHVSEIRVLEHPLAGHDSFFMTHAYQLPDNDCACVSPGTSPAATRAIGRLKVRSFITNVRDGEQVPAGRRMALRGIAFDGGSGIRSVEISGDGGRSWQAAGLGRDLGRFSFRAWQLDFTPKAGAIELMVRATANDGETQPTTATWNPGGYQRNVIETTRINAI